MRKFVACLALLSSIALTSFLPAQAKPATAPVKKDTPAEEGKSFETVIKGYKAIPGLFTFYRNAETNKVLMEIKPDQLDKIYLSNVTLEAGDGYYFDSGAMLDNFPFILKKVGKRVQFIHKNVYYRAQEGSPIARAVGRDLTNSIVGSAAIESKPNPKTKSILIDPADLFIQDYSGVTQVLNTAKIDYKFDRQESYFGPIKSFPLNSEIETVLHFKNSGREATEFRIPDSRSMQHRYRYSLSTLPETGYRPRLADDRVGQFLTLYQDYTNQTKDTAYVRYVNRWNLEKTDPNAALSPAKQPIVFWLENTIPEEYRETVTQGVLVWNKAFEKAGIKDAIVVKQQPDTSDWDPADVRYNTIRWIVNPGGGYAVGPSRTNPFTGEIYDADIRFSADFVRAVARDFEEEVNPVTAVRRNFTALLGNRRMAQYLCDYSEQAMRETSFGWNLVNTRVGSKVDSPEGQAFIKAALLEVVAHEVGHTLGLRHNFKASTIHALTDVHDRALTLKEGVSASVMDYNPVNLAPDGKPQGEFYNSSLGLYDYWAIAYAYTPITASSAEGELPELQKIASLGSQEKLAYGTDEDADAGNYPGVDPTTNRFDLGNDPIAFAEERVGLAQELLGKIESEFSTPGARYQKMRLVFGNVLYPYRAAAANVPKFVGGLYTRRDRIGDPGNRTPFEPVSAAKQQQAMDFLKQHIFGAQAFQFPPSLINKLTPERFEDFDFALYSSPRQDYPVHTQVLNIQKTALNNLYSPVILSRMVDLPLHYRAGEPTFTMTDMFRETRLAVWSEVTQNTKVNSFRRNLQRAHLDKVIGLVVQPTMSPVFTAYSGTEPASMIPTPEDARTLARADLVALQKIMAPQVNNGGLDELTRAHYDESLARIKAALEAGIQRGG